ncbi:uracil phosphoribosyltransferase [Dyadobacter sandarakinus]|uniref:Uracil phosphoribosyltransferase n=1 Tax=Dyadobacter sandarakinus TaxID=2747268 RepID=A0ABX7IC82_9BACT|nr:uracil phosphoribosyltransferase [Dyadobacter sandarakinus]QRR02748.1 uracil phosphoribosyltransferase [Dyadobacter sandarakinus]
MFLLSQKPSIADHYIAELRDVNIQKDRLRFRRNMERIGELLAYELSKTLTYRTEQTETPLGQATSRQLLQPVVLATILRAGLPLHEGFLNMFDKADNAFIGAYRGHHINDEDEFEVEMDYITSPDLTGKILILIDPMLATGRSLEKVYHALLRFGIPAQTHIAAVIASPEGVAFLQKRIPQCRLWLGSVDTRLNEQYYIVPGIGDAGDLAFGEK